MRVIIDGVAFSLNDPAVARTWERTLPHLATVPLERIVLLDRGDAPDHLDGIEVVPFPSYTPSFGAADSILLEEVCRHFGANVFVSTHDTTPLETPSVLVVDKDRGGRERSIAIAHARRFVCVSAAVRTDFLASHPELTGSPVAVANPGADLADALMRELAECATARAAGQFDDFAGKWKDLRWAQAAVDVW